ncbi:MAG: nitrate/TMAO reductase-like tetraheme cytochrome c subunit, partial [Myxococcota bacterium]
MARKRSTFKRTLGFFERALPWMLLLLTASGAGAGLYLLISLGTSTFRGHSGIGLLMGILAVGLGLLSGLYSYRKRAGQEGILGRGRMTAWLWFHLTIGLLAGFYALLHSGFGAFRPRLTTGWLLLICFEGLVLSGIAWRAVYRNLPPRLQPQIRNYATRSAQKRADRHAVEIEKLSAGHSELFHALKREVLSTGTDPTTLPGADSLTSEERAALGEIASLSRRRQAHLDRLPAQEEATWKLQRWRWLHIPLAVGFVVLLPVHIIGAFGGSAEMMPSVGSAHAPSEECADCHASIVAEWEDSMHAHALNSPLMVVQNNVAVRETLPEEAKQVCVNCHGPLSTVLDGGANLPFDGAMLSSRSANEGIGCVDCHQLVPEKQPDAAVTLWTGRSDPGVLTYGLSAIGGLADFRDFYDPGWDYYGNNPDPVGNRYHDSDTLDL